MNVLVTGGAGYIGSHAALRLLEAGHVVTVVDDLSRGNLAAVDALRSVGDVRFVEGDFGDRALMEPVLRDAAVEVVMHFAALAYVGESVQVPLRYWSNNLARAIMLLEAMDACGVDRMVFSSTCATYGEPPPDRIPIREDCPQRPVNPYGRSKLGVEQMLADYLAACTAAGRPFSYAALRYFNVAGSDPEGRIGEVHDPETHLVPICLQAALGQRPGVTVFGTDYDTPDGTCVRDYVHVDDLVRAHLLVMDALRPGASLAYNVGIGRGHSVREVVDACRRVTGRDIAVTEGPRRAGDPAVLFSDSTRIQQELGWSPLYTGLDETIRTAWGWMRGRV